MNKLFAFGEISKNVDKLRQSVAAAYLKIIDFGVASVMQDYGMQERNNAPEDSREVHN